MHTRKAAYFFAANPLIFHLPATLTPPADPQFTAQRLPHIWGGALTIQSHAA